MALQVVRAIWGALLLLAPHRELNLIGDDSPGVSALTRVLGARHLLEAGILMLRRRPRPARWPVVVDLAHALSMVAVAACSRRHRRPAVASAIIASSLAIWAGLERWPADG